MDSLHYSLCTWNIPPTQAAKKIGRERVEVYTELIQEAHQGVLTNITNICRISLSQYFFHHLNGLQCSLHVYTIFLRLDARQGSSIISWSSRAIFIASSQNSQPAQTWTVQLFHVSAWSDAFHSCWDSCFVAQEGCKNCQRSCDGFCNCTASTPVLTNSSQQNATLIKRKTYQNIKHILWWSLQKLPWCSQKFVELRLHLKTCTL